MIDRIAGGWYIHVFAWVEMLVVGSLVEKKEDESSHYHIMTILLHQIAHFNEETEKISRYDAKSAGSYSYVNS